MSEPKVVLHQFLASHFNEKARWGLDWKGIRHERVSYLPGPHAPAIKKLAPGTTTPVVAFGDEVVQGSAAILAALDERYPEKPLLPAGAADQKRALEIQEEFDAEVGPAIRAALFSSMMEHGDYVTKLFARDKALPTRLFYRALFPVARGMIRKEYGLGDARAVEAAFARTERALDFVAKTADGDGPLVGDRFSVADLTCAALLAIAANPDHPDMKRPEPIPESVQAFRARFADHPAVAWVRAQYAQHRPPPHAI